MLWNTSVHLLTELVGIGTLDKQVIAVEGKAKALIELRLLFPFATEIR